MVLSRHGWLERRTASRSRVWRPHPRARPPCRLVHVSKLKRSNTHITHSQTLSLEKCQTHHSNDTRHTTNSDRRVRRSTTRWDLWLGPLLKQTKVPLGYPLVSAAAPPSGPLRHLSLSHPQLPSGAAVPQAPPSLRRHRPPPSAPPPVWGSRPRRS